jgi:eukaryotic-like serine/threonine-protein kinase
MTNARENWPTVQKLFDELIDLPEAQWDAVLTTRRVPEPIRGRVRTLLAAAHQQGPLDKGPALFAGATLPEADSLTAGTSVGDFIIDRSIGSGGMGEVFEAHREGDGFRQRAALKLLRVNASDNRAAFTRERQLLAELEHPGIARLIDGGIAGDGRPYLAMEFVDGQPIDLWAKAEAADLDTRLKLFLEICNTLAFAHAQLIVHRDLKPSNILVDKEGRTRLVDFGIAKLLDDVVPESGAQTTLALMTPDFAAPEQLEGGTISVATDIYALGGVLYVLLTGHTPWSEEGSSMPATIRRILSGDPPAPSRAARPEGPVPPRAIRGDLDAIVLKAMRREPGERYASASELAEDVRRHLALEPVHARAGTRRYRLGRFARRYRWGLIASAAVAASLVAGMIGIAIQGHRAAVERDVAIAEAERADAVVQMVTLMTADSSGQADMSVKTMLDGAAKRLLSTADHSPRSAGLVVAMADFYINRQDPKGLYDFLKAALAHGIGKEDAVGTAEMKVRLANITALLGNDAEALQLIDQAEPAFAGNDERLVIGRVDAIGVRAQLARKAGDYPRAIKLLMDNLPEAERALASHQRELLTRYNNILVYLIEANELDQFKALMPRVDAAMARTGQRDSIQGLGIRLTEAAWRVRTGEVATAEQLFREISNKRRQLYPGTAGLATDLFQLSRVLVAQHKFAEARAAMDEALPIAQATLGPDAIPTLMLETQMIEVDAENGQVQRAATRFDQIAPKFATLPLPPQPIANLARTEAILRINQHRPAEAAAALDKAAAIMTKMGPAGASFVKGLAPIRARIKQGG